MYTQEQATEASIAYFNGDVLAAKVFLDKYALRDENDKLLEKTPEDMHRRMAKEFARIERRKFKEPMTEDEIFSLLDRFKYICPQGSPMAGIGNDYQITSLSNCYVLETPEDSYSSILHVDEQLVNISKRRGGVGINLSKLRPAGTATSNAARSSTGIGTWMERYSHSIREVGQNARRGALMLCLDIRHPDIETFITIKQDNTKVTGANVSVMLNKEFIQAVEHDEDFQLQWPVDAKSPKVIKKVKAKELWDLLVKSARDNAEPGILMWDNFLENGPADQYAKYRSEATNPCSEISLCPFDSCRLIALNLYSFVANPFTKQAYFDYILFGQVVEKAQKLMDDLVDLETEKIDRIIAKINSDPEDHRTKANELYLWNKVREFNVEGRRTGLGITALGDTLAALGIRYGSTESIEETEKIYKRLKLSAYQSSVDMAEELGAFEGFSEALEKDCPFIQHIAEEDPALYEKMRKVGRRNVAITTTAPTGSLSLLTQTSSGIEPVFMLAYTRRRKINAEDKKINTNVDFVDQNGDEWQEYEVFHPKVVDWKTITGLTNIEDSPWFNATANDIDWENRVKLQAAAQKHVCHSISSTVNLPHDVTAQEVDRIYRTAFASGCKGLTVYRDGCRSGVLVATTDKKDENKISHTTAPKRPNEVISQVFHTTIKGHRYYVVVGLLEGDPYEVFVGSNHNHEGDIIIPKSVENGYVVKKSRGQYILHVDGKEYKLTNGHSDDNAEALTRMISLALRHGADMSFVVHQLEKVEGDMLCFAKVIARTFKKLIKDGTKVHGEECPKCGSADIIRQEGCVACKSCGWTKC